MPKVEALGWESNNIGLLSNSDVDLCDLVQVTLSGLWTCVLDDIHHFLYLYCHFFMAWMLSKHVHYGQHLAKQGHDLGWHFLATRLSTKTHNWANIRIP